MKMEPPNKDSFFLSLAFCIEAYNMNLDGTNLAIGVEHEDFPGKVAKVGKIQVRVSRKFEHEGAIFELFSGSEVIEHQNINQICWKILQQQMILVLQ
ncbi:hypothetical protein D5086_012721 [Populus alba]|uniref:Uncharacterized protein n=1 Tax=Populus alba TaxID=43335 RepID=A0ACC4C5Q3_POPAL